MTRWLENSDNLWYNIYVKKSCYRSGGIFVFLGMRKYGGNNMSDRIYDPEEGFCSLGEWCRRNQIEKSWAEEMRKEGWSLKEIKLGERITDYAVRNWGIK